MRPALILGVLLATTAPALAFDTWWHAEETRVAAEANGFTSDARLVLQVENYLTDMIGGISAHVDPSFPDFVLSTLNSTRLVDDGYNYVHFDALWDVSQVSRNWDQLEKNTISAITKYSKLSGGDSFRKIAELTALAASLHVVQDFYSHSNWVNYWMEHGGKVPLWFDVPAADRAKLPIHTGAYPDGSAPGHENHADLNKDNSTRPLNAEAVDAATRASTAWIVRLMAEAPSLPWDEMKSYDIQKDLVMKNFLYALDSNFLTTTSIVMGHFDGPQPKRMLFATDTFDERKQALYVLKDTVDKYRTFIDAKGNPDKLPSPYWSSQFIYHVPRDIASGLMVAGKIYIREVN